MAIFVSKVSLKIDLTENRYFSKQQDIRTIVINPGIMSSIISLIEITWWQMKNTFLYLNMKTFLDLFIVKESLKLIDKYD